MKSAYVELEYRRKEDGVPVTLLAPLPTVRAIVLGGAPEELRLPGADHDAAFGRIELENGQHRLTPASPAAGLRLNGRPAHGAGVILEPHDVVRLERWHLTFHEGETPSDSPLIATHLRWSMPQSMLEDANIHFDEGSRPHIDEFELSIRPYLQADRFDRVKEMAEREIQRVVRSADIDALDDYLQYLWWTRLRMAREASDPKAGDIAREAFDLFPESRLLMVSCGLSYMIEQRWDLATEAFDRVLRPDGRSMLVSVHDARVGKRLIEHWSSDAREHSSYDAFPAELLESKDWNAPTIELDAPGDDILMCRMAWHGRLFGRSDAMRFVFYGKDEERSDHEYEVLRWEMHDTSRGQAWRRLVRFPAMPWPDPSLCLEVDVIRQGVLQHHPFARLFVDRSSAVRAPEAPVLFHESALAVLPKTIGKRRMACARLSRRDDRMWLNVVAEPEKGDVVYRQGEICVAVSEEVVRRCRAHVLTHVRRRGFELITSAGDRTSVRYKGPRLFRGSFGRTQLLACAAVLLLLCLMFAYFAGILNRG